MSEMTPMMAQYFEIKKDYPDTILFFRLGDFYEMFFEDAKTASSVLELTLTGRACGNGEKAPMCGVPFHSADNYIARLVKNGYKVAICEQVEDPATAKGIVRRDVVRIITKGSIIENNMLDENKNNYLTSIYVDENGAGICFVDVSTGTLNLTSFSGEDDIEACLINEIGVFSPSEIILNKTCAQMKGLTAFISKKIEASCELPDDDYFAFDDCFSVCCEHFTKEKITSLGLDNMPSAIASVGSAIKYLKNVQKNDLDNIREINLYSESQFMKINYSTKRDLEIVETMRSREKKGSLLWVLDSTGTSMGKRLLRSWLEKPLINLAQISRRHNAVDELYNDNMKLTELSAALKNIFDIERLLTRIVYETATAKDLNSLKQTITSLPAIKAQLADCKSAYLVSQHNALDCLEDIYNLIDSAIREDAPFTVREGDLIREGFNEELDYLADIKNNGKKYIAEIESREKEATGIPKLRIGYNRVFGYYIEVTNSYKELVPETYIRKQTLSNCERYITEELKSMLCWALTENSKPVALRYPRGGDRCAIDAAWDSNQSVVVQKTGKDAAVITYGPLVSNALDAAEILKRHDIDTAVIRLTQIAPLPTEQIAALIDGYKCLLFAEETCEGAGIGDALLASLVNTGLGAKIKILNLGQRYITHGAVDKLYAHSGLDGKSIANNIMEMLKVEN